MTSRDSFGDQEGESPLNCAEHGTWRFTCGKHEGKVGAWEPRSQGGHTAGEPRWGRCPEAEASAPPSALAAELGPCLSELEEERLKPHIITQITAPKQP